MPADVQGVLDVGAGFVSDTEQSVAARRLIFRERDTLEFLPLICRGWAACSVTLFDGRRQILSFLLPGDMAPTAMVFDEVAHVSVEAVTDVQFRAVRRAELKAALLRDASLFERFSRLWAAEKLQADQLAVDLGRRSADERIARLILGLAERMRQRGFAEGNSFEFPLRQHHIADATGLTSVHVSKVLTEFRRAGSIEISERALTIKDPGAFRAIANMR
jgi:CRP-like cAMP-binding protein